MDFTGKVVVITGGSQGIGKAISFGFARGGAEVIILDINAELATQVKDEICAEGLKANFVQLDVSNTSAAQAVIDQIVKDYGKIDVLVNNAGIVSSKNFFESDERDWDRIININLKGVFNTCHAAMPYMIERKYGKIVNIASIAGKRGGGVFGTTLYATSKAGVIGLTKGLAREGGQYGVNVNAICPGPTNTSMLDSFQGERRLNFMNSIPLRRFAEPEDIANAVMFLGSDLARHITGEITDVDGGTMMD
ncbi:MAG: 3-oxoacyl-[acyl-carrier protein] reductase [Clostridiales bacterium]|nr:3-oxoacyl-[acyl-carrier protein] reductase [Clostridiales bacterium]